MSGTFSNSLGGEMSCCGGGLRSFSKANGTQLSELVAGCRAPHAQPNCSHSPTVIYVAHAWFWYHLQMSVNMGIPLQSLDISFLGFLCFALS